MLPVKYRHKSILQSWSRILNSFLFIPEIERKLIMYFPAAKLRSLNFCMDSFQWWSASFSTRRNRCSDIHFTSFNNVWHMYYIKGSSVSFYLVMFNKLKKKIKKQTKPSFLFFFFLKYFHLNNSDSKCHMETRQSLFIR